MQITINEKNIGNIETAIKIAEGKARERTITLEDINSSVKKIEKKLEGILAKKNWEGLTFTLDPNAQHFPSAYKYTPESTHVCIIRKSTTWKIVSIYRGNCGRTDTKRIVPGNIESKKDQIAEFVSHSKCW